MAKMPKEVMELLGDLESQKILVTADSAGDPNAAPKGSMTAVDDETIAYADIMGEKTNANLKVNKKVVVIVSKTRTSVYQIKGIFQGYQTSGPLFDAFVKKLEPRNMKPKAAGTIKVSEVYSSMPAKKLA